MVNGVVLMMELRVSCFGENSDKIIDIVTKRINACGMQELSWDVHTGRGDVSCRTEIARNTGEVEMCLKSLQEQYQQLDIYASYSYPVREGDSSAQWWGTETLSTKKNGDGSKYLFKSAETGWH